MLPPLLKMLFQEKYLLSCPVVQRELRSYTSNMDSPYSWWSLSVWFPETGNWLLWNRSRQGSGCNARNTYCIINDFGDWEHKKDSQGPGELNASWMRSTQCIIGCGRTYEEKRKQYDVHHQRKFKVLPFKRWVSEIWWQEDKNGHDISVKLPSLQKQISDAHTSKMLNCGQGSLSTPLLRSAGHP